MEWQTIESAPKDGKPLAIWCARTETMILDCAWIMDEWREWRAALPTGKYYWPLRPHEIPTQWLRIEQPQESDRRNRMYTQHTTIRIAMIAAAFAFTLGVLAVSLLDVLLRY